MRKKICVVAAVLKNSENQILIVQRPPNKELSGYWEFPGGKVEKGEALDLALQRELKEELSITFELANLSKLTHFMYSLEDKDIDFTFYMLKTWNGYIQLNEGQPQYAWINPTNLSQYKMPEPNIKIHQLLTTL